MLGYGLQSSVLGVRAVIEEFSVVVTGIMMSSYYLGFLIGSLLAPRTIAGVGHIRVFAAFASVASAAVLLHPVVVAPLAWAVMRFVTGFCYAGLYVVIESWLNEVADNQTRGRLLSLYGLVMLGGMAGGYLLLSVGDPGSFGLFTFTSILISLSLVPIALSNGATISPLKPSPVAIHRLLANAPLGVVGCLFLGAAHGIAYTMGPVYARTEGLSLFEISAFMAGFLIGGMLLQWPIGRASDVSDRRKIIGAAALAAAGVSVAALLVGRSYLPDLALALATLILGGLSLPLYALCVAHVNDHLDRPEIVPATSLLILTVGAGAAAGPLIAGLVMWVAGPGGFYLSLAGLHGSIALVAVLTIARSLEPRTPRQRSYELPTRATAMAAPGQNGDARLNDLD